MEQYHYLVLEPEFIFREDHPKDYIFEQDIEPNTLVATGSTLKVKVSLGTPNLVVPDFKGLKLNSYLRKLEDMGLEKAIDGGGNNNIAPGTQSQYYWGYQAKMTTSPNQTTAPTTETTTKDGKKHIVKYISKVDWNYQNSYVCAVEPEPGTPFNATEDYEITVYYAYNPVYINVTQTGTSTTRTGTGTKNTKLTGTSGLTTKTTAKLPPDDPDVTTKQQQQEQTQPPVSATQPPVSVTDPPPVVTEPQATEPPPPPPPPSTEPPQETPNAENG
jgi:hypothetical protein